MRDHLDNRAGLPADLRVLADKYPRPVWTGHANFNELTAFWLDRHGMFRRVIQKLQSNTESFLDGAQPRFAPEVSRYTGFFLEQLHAHHTIEDDHYFPKFTQLDTRLERAFDLLDSDHHALDGHLHALADHTNAVLAKLQQGHEARSQAGTLLQTQKAFATFLERHLSDEEEIIVPLVLEYGGGFD